MASRSTEVSGNRLFIGNLPKNATKGDVEAHFATHGHGKITEIKLMNGFGFVQYEDELDARDVVPAFHGSTLLGERIVVQFAHGNRTRNDPYAQDRMVPRPRRTPFCMAISNLLPETSWQDLKDFSRISGVDVVYTEVSREKDGRGFVEFETLDDLQSAIEKLDGREFKGQSVRCVEDVRSGSPGRGPPPRGGPPYSNYPGGPPPRDRYHQRHRSRSPGPYSGGGGGGFNGYPQDYRYDRGSPRRRYSPPPYPEYPPGYRRRSPPRQQYDPRDRYPQRGPNDFPPAPPRHDDYGPPPPRHGRYPEEDFGHGRPPPPPAHPQGGNYNNVPDGFANNNSNNNNYGGNQGRYNRGPPTPRGRSASPGRGGYEAGYDRQQRSYA